MSDLKCERWSCSDSNSALQVLQVHLTVAPTFLGPLSTFSVTSRVSAEEFLELPRGSGIEVSEECGDHISWQKSKKSGGSSKMESCRLSC